MGEALIKRVCYWRGYGFQGKNDAIFCYFAEWACANSILLYQFLKSFVNKSFWCCNVFEILFDLEHFFFYAKKLWKSSKLLGATACIAATLMVILIFAIEYFLPFYDQI